MGNFGPPIKATHFPWNNDKRNFPPLSYICFQIFSCWFIIYLLSETQVIPQGSHGDPSHWPTNNSNLKNGVFMYSFHNWFLLYWIGPTVLSGFVVIFQVRGHKMRKNKQTKAGVTRTARTGNLRQKAYQYHSSLRGPHKGKQKASQTALRGARTSILHFCKIHAGIVNKTYCISALWGNFQAPGFLPPISLQSPVPFSRVTVPVYCWPFQTWPWQRTRSHPQNHKVSLIIPIYNYSPIYEY